MDTGVIPLKIFWQAIYNLKEKKKIVCGSVQFSINEETQK